MKKNKFPPLFIGGTGCCGTTLLVDLIGLHPDISPIYETGFVIVLINIFNTDKYKNTTFEEKKEIYLNYIYNWSKNLPHRPDSKRGYERYVHGPHHICFDRKYIRNITENFLNKLSPLNYNKLVPDYLKSLFNEHTRIDKKKYWISKKPLYILYLPLILNWFPENLWSKTGN